MSRYKCYKVEKTFAGKRDKFYKNITWAATQGEKFVKEAFYVAADGAGAILLLQKYTKGPPLRGDEGGTFLAPARKVPKRTGQRVAG